MSTVALSHLPRSILLYDFSDKKSESAKFLFVGMSNGSVAYGRFENRSLDNIKVAALGDSPVSLLVREASRSTVLAFGSRSAILTMSEDAINHSPLLLKVILISVAHMATSEPWH